jgi:hypothetical protein
LTLHAQRLAGLGKLAAEHPAAAAVAVDGAVPVLQQLLHS